MAEPTDRLPAIQPVRFWRTYAPGPDGINQPVDWVEWVKKGDRTGATTAEKVSRLGPTDNRHPAVEWAVVEPFYQAWLRKEDAPVTGTPLAAWPGCPREMADELKKLNVFSVEDLAALADHNLQHVPFPNARETRRRAQAFVEAKGANDVAERLAERDDKISRLEDKNRDLETAVKLMEEEIARIKAERPAGGAGPAASRPQRNRRADLEDDAA